MTRLMVCVGLLACIGCSSSREIDSTKDTSSVSARSPSRDRTAMGDPVSLSSSDACPATGQWALCSLEKRLRRSGFVLNRIDGEEPTRPGFDMKPAVYTLGHGRVEVFLYDDDKALADDLADIDTIAVAKSGTAGTWPSPPTLVRSGNLAAVFMDQTPRQSERFVLAITAGAPSR